MEGFRTGVGIGALIQRTITSLTASLTRSSVRASRGRRLPRATPHGSDASLPAVARQVFSGETQVSRLSRPSGTGGRRPEEPPLFEACEPRRLARNIAGVISHSMLAQHVTPTYGGEHVGPFRMCKQFVSGVSSVSAWGTCIRARSKVSVHSRWAHQDPGRLFPGSMPCTRLLGSSQQMRRRFYRVHETQDRTYTARVCVCCCVSRSNHPSPPPPSAFTNPETLQILRARRRPAWVADGGTTYLGYVRPAQIVLVFFSFCSCLLLLAILTTREKGAWRRLRPNVCELLAAVPRQLDSRGCRPSGPGSTRASASSQACAHP